MLIANQKYIDTACIQHLLGAGEKNIDKIKIAIDRFYLGEDLSGCLFTLRAINSSGGLVMQNLEKEITPNKIILTWMVDETFTAVPGTLSPEIVCCQADIIVIKYEMTPMVVRGSVLEQYNGGIDAIDKALQEMQRVLAKAQELTIKLPRIRNGTWWLYDVETAAYVDSGFPAQGEKGDAGLQGIPGPAGASAYEIWLEEGNQGTKADFIASLKGEKGDATLEEIEEITDAEIDAIFGRTFPDDNIIEDVTEEEIDSLF